MPLLRKETEIQPESIFELDVPWHAAHVRSRQEKLLARYLQERDIPFYLPLVEKKASRGGRLFRSYLPLFPGYVFFRAEPPTLADVRRSGVIAGFVAVDDQQMLNVELNKIRQLQRAGASLTPHLEPLEGDTVRVADGVFRDYFGIVERSRVEGRFLVRLSLLDRVVAVDLPRGALVKFML